MNVYATDSTRIVNDDESRVPRERNMHGFTSAKTLIPWSGCKDVCIFEFRNLSRITIMPVIIATGFCAPPLFVFNGAKLPRRTVLKDRDVTIETTESCLSAGSMAVTREENEGIDTAKSLDWGYTFVDYVEPLTTDSRKLL